MKNFLILVLLLASAGMAYWHFADWSKGEVVESCIQGIPADKDAVSFDRYGYCGCVADATLEHAESIAKQPSYTAQREEQVRVSARCFETYLEAALMDRCDGVKQQLPAKQSRRLDCQCFSKGMYGEYMAAMANIDIRRMDEQAASEMSKRVTEQCIR